MSQSFHGPGSVPDLLRQAMAQNANKRVPEDPHDSILSGTQTPSGIQTPRPDFQDKRLPGILNGYFGQVGDQAPPKSRAHHPSPSTSKLQAMTLQELGRSEKSSRRGSAASHGSMVEVDRDFTTDTPPTPVDTTCEDFQAIEKPSTTPQSQTPLSADPEVIRKGGPFAQNGIAAGEAGLLSITQALISLVKPKSRFTADQSSRHASQPTAHISRKSVVAAHFSNPTSTVQSPQIASPASPTSDSLLEIPKSISVQELSKLTLDAAPEPREKNTPPQTPRALSHVDGPRSPQSDKSATTSDNGRNAQSPTRRKDGLPGTSSRGKLAVTIVEGRNLQPANDPYCVCVFEWNEYISKGPQPDDMDVDSNDRKTSLRAGMPMQRTDSEIGRSMAIPMRSRQSSSNGHDPRPLQRTSDPTWNHEATFDVVGRESDVDISVYDRRPGQTQDVFLGHVRTNFAISEYNPSAEKWLPLLARGDNDSNVTGEILVKMQFSKTDRRQFGPNDFQILKLIGKGTFGQVYQVRKKDTGRIYAMKVLSKKVIIQKKEIAHTIGERNILVRTATTDSPFIVGLKFSFQTPTDLYLVTDFMSGGELFWHLQKEGKFLEKRAKFYIAELILALKHLHEHDIVYRDLKPENILLDANGHIALCDFGLSKANLTKNDTTNTFCGTTEYLAPEVLLDEAGYTKMVDFWSLGVLVFEMCCGWSPFYAEDTQQMYKNIAFGKVRFPRDALSGEGRNFVKGLLNRNPKHRLGATSDAQELIEHPFFADIDWTSLAKKQIPPPFKPKLTSMADTSHFDPEFTNALNTSSSLNARAELLSRGAATDSTPLSPTMQDAFKNFTFVDESALESQFNGRQHEFDDDPNNSLDRRRTRDELAQNRMSGVQRTDTREEGMFGTEDWEM